MAGRAARGDPLVVRRQNELFDLHRVWVAEQEAAGIPFHPEEWTADKSEYNLLAADMEADGDALDGFHRRASEILGRPAAGRANGAAAATRAESAVRPQVLAIVRGELAQLHLPGKHDQSSHGRNGVAVIDPADVLPTLTRDPSVSRFSHLTDDAYASNPRYGEPQFDNNCVHVVSAYELRARGFDATASPLPTALGDNGRKAQEALERWVLPDGSPHGRTINVQSGVPVRDVIATTEAWPDGARGWITFSYDPRYSAGSHIFNVEKIDGEVIYVDAQTSEPYLDLKRVIRRSKDAGEAPVWGVARVDDLEPTDAVMEFIEPGGGS